MVITINRPISVWPMTNDTTHSFALHPGAAAIALAGTLVVLFVLCALAEFAFPGPRLSHAWLNLFTTAPTGSARAWAEGLLASLVFGGISGALFAAIYNGAARR
jgi:hypothetical protein